MSRPFELLTFLSVSYIKPDLTKCSLSFRQEFTVFKDLILLIQNKGSMKLPSFLRKIKKLYQDQVVLFLPLQHIQLSIIGVWPLGAQVTYWYIVLGFFNSIFNGVTTLAEFAFSYYHRDNLEDILASLSPALTKMNIACKIFVMVSKRDQFFDIVSTLEKYYNDYTNLSEIRISRKLSRRSYVICLILSVFSQMTGLFFVILPIFRNVTRILTNEPRISELPFKSEWPWNLDRTPFYVLTYLLQAYGSWLTSCAVAGIDCVFMGIFLHVAAEFRCISCRIKEFGCEIDKKTTDLTVLTKEENNQMETQIKEIIKQHCSRIELCDKLRDFGKEIILGHFLTSSLTVCMTSVNLLIAEWSQKPVYVTYILTVLTQAFVYCYGGELMSEAVIANVQNSLQKTFTITYITECANKQGFVYDSMAQIGWTSPRRSEIDHSKSSETK